MMTCDETLTPLAMGEGVESDAIETIRIIKYWLDESVYHLELVKMSIEIIGAFEHPEQDVSKGVQRIWLLLDCYVSRQDMIHDEISARV
jgi:hypothetical protein